MSDILEAVEAERVVIAEIRVYLDERERTLDEIAALAGQLEPLVFDPAKSKLPEPHRNGRRAERAEPLKRALPPARPMRRRTASSEVAKRRVRLVALIRELEPAAARDLARRSEINTATLQKDLQALRAQGLIQSDGRTGHSRWHLTETLDRQAAVQHAGPRSARCREDVLQTIRSEPGKWSEQRMADAGAWDREQVADACGRLLEEGEVALLSDGTYRPAFLLGQVAA